MTAKTATNVVNLFSKCRCLECCEVRQRLDLESTRLHILVNKTLNIKDNSLL